MKSFIYLDYCATTPLDPRVRDAMLPLLGETFGNPSSMHWAGQAAAKILDTSRQTLADRLVCDPEEIVFTSGATEADNLALTGILRKFPASNAHLITSQVEHHAVLHSAAQLEKEGYSVTYLPVDNQGLIDPKAVETAIKPETRLISIMLVNNEVGSIQPVQKIVEIAHRHFIPVHTDAVQGMGLPGMSVKALGVDLLSLSGHKIYGPKGIGALYVNKSIELTPMLFGGTQEGGRRAGTENLAGIAGLAEALRLARTEEKHRHEHLSNFRARLMQGLRNRIPDIQFNGPTEKVAPHILSVTFNEVAGEALLYKLNTKGFAVSMGSACTSRSIEPSHVLLAMGLSREQIEGTLRISLGYPTTLDEVDAFIETMIQILHHLRES